MILLLRKDEALIRNSRLGSSEQTALAAEIGVRAGIARP